MLKIFITNLSEYNKGNLIGEWVSLPSDSSFLNQTIRKILSSDESEEVFITDWEWDNKTIFEIGEYDNIQLLNSKIFKLHKLTSYQLESISFLIKENICKSDNIDDCINHSYDVVIHRNKSMRDIGIERILEIVGLNEIPSIITNNIDFDGVGEEIRVGGYFVENGNTIYEYIGE